MRTFRLMAALSAVFFYMIFTPAQAQELPEIDDGFEVETDSGIEGESGFDLSRYIGGAVGFINGDGSKTSRQLAALQLDFDLPATDRLKTFMSLDVADFKNTYTLELKERLRDDRQACISYLF